MLQGGIKNIDEKVGITFDSSMHLIINNEKQNKLIPNIMLNHNISCWGYFCVVTAVPVLAVVALSAFHSVMDTYIWK